MWGHVLTEATTQQNFNFGFSTYKSEILVHLSQWQYWWWFWFSLWWALYYFIILRTMTKRTFNFNVTINTSVRGRGKWGDFLVALIPVSWCCNILINSNFILRMIEWQNESSLFTIRIQGKQWYWVYKYDPNTAQAVITTPKNIGHNRWRVVAGQESYNADTYYQAIHLAAHLEFTDSYEKFTKKNESHKIFLYGSTINAEKNLLTTSWASVNPAISDFNNSQILANFEHNIVYSSINHTSKNLYNKPESTRYFILMGSSSEILSKKITVNLSELFNFNSVKTSFTSPFELINIFIGLTTKPSTNNFYDYLQLDDTYDVDSNHWAHTTTQPFRLARGVLNQHVLDVLQYQDVSHKATQKPLLFKVLFNKSAEDLKEKTLMPETLWGFRQKKYKRVKKYKFKDEVIYDPTTFEVIGKKTLPTHPNIDIAQINTINIDQSTNNSHAEVLVKPKIKKKSVGDDFNYRITNKINKHRSELVPVTLARRLLRTKRTLVLPSHVNLTIITNSYDVVHSWFVPGLGLKMDCVPGRSTHHTFYIDNIGFYYGQCAEICGRYHHHMPIRLCALSFNHFVVWWQAKGLARMDRTNLIRKNRFSGTSISNSITPTKLIYRQV